MHDGQVVIPTVSGGSARNLAENSTATLLFPPAQHRGYSLIVDGSAVPADEGFTLTPTHAVLHRPADHQQASTDAGCGHDCRQV